MDPTVASAGISAMTSLTNGVFGYLGTRYASDKATETAEKNRQFQLEMAEKQRKEALEDRAHAEMYNSPLMERLRREAAGLGPVDDYSTPGTPAQGLAPDYAAATAGTGDALVSAAQLGASAPMVMMDKALEAGRISAQIMKDRSLAVESSQSARLKAINATLNELTLQDDVAAKRLENDLTFQKTQNLIQEGLNLVESGRLTRVERKKAEVDLNIALQTQEMKVELVKQDVEQAKIKTKLDEAQLYQVLPKQLKYMDSEIERNRAAANLANSQSRRINVLLPYEQKQLQESCSLLAIAVKTGTLEYDENVVKHNKFMSHIKEYEENLIASYNLPVKEARWYAINQGVNILSKAASTALVGVGIGKYVSALPAVSAAAPALKNAGLALPGSAAYERLANGLGNSMPGIR